MPLVISDEVKPPKIVSRKEYYLEVLGPKHNERDFEAWSSSKESLKGVFGPSNSWPEDVASLQDNLRDLENHLREFKEREAFTYSIISKDEKTCLGCLYIRPSIHPRYEARVDFWFRDSHLSLQDDFFTWLKDWMRDYWKLKATYPGKTQKWKDYLEGL